MSFNRTDNKPIYMAGVYNLVDNAERFVVITTEANESVSNIHDRMPLILEKNEIDMWIYADKVTEYILNKKPPKLEQNRRYEQQTLERFL